MQFCFSCGSELKEGFNFCPKCGVSLEVSSGISTPPISNEIVSESVTVKICEYCGEENPSTAINCKGCGIRITDTPVTTTKRTTAISIPEKIQPESRGTEQTKQPHSKEHKKNKSHHTTRITAQTPAPQVKQLAIPQSTLLLMFSVLVVGAVIILYASGVFDKADANTSPVTPQGNTNAPANNSVDLSALQQINALRTVVKNDPTNKEKTLELAHLLNDSGFFEEAISFYQKYLSMNPSDPDAIIDMGVCYFNLKNYAVADSVMKTALKINPKHQIGLFNLGIVNLSRGDVATANKWFQECINVNPSSEQAQKARHLLENH